MDVNFLRGKAEVFCSSVLSLWCGGPSKCSTRTTVMSQGVRGGTVKGQELCSITEVILSCALRKGKWLLNLANVFGFIAQTLVTLVVKGFEFYIFVFVSMIKPRAFHVLSMTLTSEPCSTLTVCVDQIKYRKECFRRVVLLCLFWK